MSHTIEIRLKPAADSAAYACGETIIGPWFPGQSRYHVSGDYTFQGPDAEVFAVIPRENLHYFLIKEDADASPEV